MSSVNKVILVGNLGKDLEIRIQQNGDLIATFSIATSEVWRDKSTGERKEKTEWHRIVIFNQPLAKLAEKYLRKGHKVYISGMLATRKWTDQQGLERYTTEVVIKPFSGELAMLERSGGGVPAAQGEDDYGEPVIRGTDVTGRSAPADDYPLNDEIPF